MKKEPLFIAILSLHSGAANGGAHARNGHFDEAQCGGRVLGSGSAWTTIGILVFLHRVRISRVQLCNLHCV